jgi:uncharacterized membrane protein YjfL (UPF0719 family)
MTYIIYLLRDYLATFGWAIVLAISLGVFVKIFSKFTPIDEWEEIKKGNIGAAIIIASIIIGAALIIGYK